MYEIVRATWEQVYRGLAKPTLPDYESFWRTAVHDGVVPNSASPAIQIALRADWADAMAQATVTPANNTLELLFRPDPSVWDGCFANNPWLQELPKPLTTLTWDNALLLSPATASRLALAAQDEVAMSFQGRSLTAAVWITPGQPDETATLHLGYGRAAGGHIGQGIGFNAYTVRTADTFFGGSGLELRKTGEQYLLAKTQDQELLEGRDLVRTGSFAQFQQEPNFAQTEFDHENGVGPDEIERAVDVP